MNTLARTGGKEERTPGVRVKADRVGLSNGAFAAAVACTCASALGQSFTALGPGPGGIEMTIRNANRDVTVLGASGLVYQGLNGYPRPYKWTANGGFQPLLGAPTSSVADISGDGSRIIGAGQPSYTGFTSFYWDTAGALHPLGLLPSGTHAAAKASNADGSVLVGIANSPQFPNGVAARWTESTGFVPLGMLPGDTRSYAYGVNSDGSVVVGTSETESNEPARGFRWTASGGMQLIPALPGGVSVFARQTNADGSVVVGSVYYTLGIPQAFRWTATGGMQDLHHRLASSSYARAISADGSVVGGGGYLRLGPHAWIWTEALGMVDLNLYLPMLGVELQGWELRDLVSMSADGRTITGNARRWTINNDPVAYSGWIATLPAVLPPCLSVSAPRLTPHCPTGSALLEAQASAIGDKHFTWQVMLATGEWVDSGAYWPQQCPGSPRYSFSLSHYNSATTQVTIHPCQTLSTFRFRALIWTACTAEYSPEVAFTICRADFNCDGAANLTDVLEYVNAWIRGDASADVLDQGTVGIENLFQFLGDWFTGC